MRPRVTAIVVAQNAAEALARTLPAIEEQTRAPERRVLVCIESRDDTEQVMRATAPDLLVTVPETTSFGEAVRAAVDKLAEIDEGDAARIEEFGTEGETPNDWLWLLSADNTPDLDALEELLDTTERNPSLEVTGPKIVRADDPAVLVEYGESVTHSGVSVRLHQDSLDQGQFEHLSDVLGVGAGGMLTKRDTWDRLDGFDRGLPAVDDGLDYSVRTWLSGGRVLLTPRARVESLAEEASGTSKYGSRTRGLQRYRIRRTAQLHRQLVWAGRVEFFFSWLLLLPAVVLRALLHLVRKNPGRILPDIRAALTVFFLQTGVPSSRRQFHKTTQQPFRSVDQLLISPTEWRKLRANRRDEYRAVAQQGRDRYNFITGGGGWLLIVAIIAAVALYFPLLSASALSGGALLPLSGSIGELWGTTGYGLRDTGGGVGVADPFNLVLAVLGTLTFWNPSQIVVVLWLLALPLAAVGGWYLAARFTRSPWLRAFAGLVWLAAPPLHIALAEGRLTGVLVHLALPWLFFTCIAGARSWAATAVCSLLALIVAASSPVLLPAMVIVWVLAMLISGRGWVRLVFTPIPAAVMFLPLLITQLNRGRPFAVFADPGLPLVVEPARGWHAATLFSHSAPHGWADLLTSLGITWDPWVVLALLQAPLALLAVIGIFTRGWRVALVGAGVAGLGYVTAGVAGGFAFATTGGITVPLWIGPAQSFGFLGVLMASLAGAVALRGARIPATAVALLAVVALIVPVAPNQFNGVSQIAPSNGRTLPALVDAQGRAAEQLGTLVITPVDGDTIKVELIRGSGQKLNQFSTLETTNLAPTSADERLANIAVGFLSQGASNPTAQLHEIGIGFVLVEPAPSSGGVLEQRLVTAMSTNEALSSAGTTSEYGTLFQVVNAAETPTDPDLAGALETTNWQHQIGRTLLLVQLAVLVFVILLALPTGGLESRVRASRSMGRPHWGDLDRGRERFTEFGAISEETVRVYNDQPTGDHIDAGEDTRA
ncbi:glycosyltransferase [Gulosibacter faecalis]|uniref:Glycosyltransferase n=1 Tax=Gulosibacter faecalis TaxID=272240 RepID=A0ABW5UWM8_9MICO|nr:glycosyltransferase [Gulosibacter faecalis]